MTRSEMFDIVRPVAAPCTCGNEDIERNERRRDGVSRYAMECWECGQIGPQRATWQSATYGWNEMMGHERPETAEDRCEAHIERLSNERRYERIGFH